MTALRWPPRTRRELIEHARLSYEAHMGVMVEWYPETRVTPWDEQDAAVREAWIEHVTPPRGEWTDFFLSEIAERDFEIGQLRNALSQRDAVLHWLQENNQAALDLCPWKFASEVYNVQLQHPEGTLLERLRYRAMAAKVNDKNITAALHAEAADEIEALQGKISEDRQLRWSLRSRLDVALARLAELGVTDV